MSDSMDKFENELADLINRHSIESHCDMPDYILARLLCATIVAVGGPIKHNLDWHGCDSVCHPKPANFAASMEDRDDEH